jgi:hypothetical protein
MLLQGLAGVYTNKSSGAELIEAINSIFNSPVKNTLLFEERLI